MAEVSTLNDNKVVEALYNITLENIHISGQNFWKNEPSVIWLEKSNNRKYIPYSSYPSILLEARKLPVQIQIFHANYAIDC